MGYMRRHAIVVTTSSDEHILAAHAKATEIFPWVSPICPPHTNGEMSFFIPPDGSKEGWDESLAGDARRDKFVAWLCEDAYLYWVEVVYAEVDGNPYVARASGMDEWGTS